MCCNIDADDHSISSPTHHNVKHLKQFFLLFWPHALGGNCYRSIWASFPMTWLTGHHLQDQWLRVYHSLSFQVATCPKARTRQIKHDFHQAKVSKVWSLLYNMWELTNVASMLHSILSPSLQSLTPHIGGSFPWLVSSVILCKHLLCILLHKDIISSIGNFLKKHTKPMFLPWRG